MRIAPYEGTACASVEADTRIAEPTVIARTPTRSTNSPVGNDISSVATAGAASGTALAAGDRPVELAHPRQERDDQALRRRCDEDGA